MTFHLDRPTREPRPVRDEVNHLAQKSVTINLPFPVSVNGMYRNAPRRGRVKSERYISWQNVAAAELRRQKFGKIDGHIAIEIDVERKDERRRDLDNMAKCILDTCVSSAIIQDDSLITDLRLSWVDSISGCRVTITPSEPRFKRRVA